MTMLIKQELAYYAGYFDGEGSVRIDRKVDGGRTKYTIAAKLANTYKPTVEGLQEAFGGGIRKHGKPPTKAWRQVWLWFSTGETAYNFLVQITPYLHEKAEQAKEAMSF